MIKVYRIPWNRRRSVLGFFDRSKNAFHATGWGWQMLRSADDPEEMSRIAAEAHLLHDLDVEAKQMEPFFDTLAAFGVEIHAF